jgi:hypothetical protein
VAPWPVNATLLFVGAVDVVDVEEPEEQAARKLPQHRRAINHFAIPIRRIAARLPRSASPSLTLVSS